VAAAAVEEPGPESPMEVDHGVPASA